jgi:thioredoxin-like negative regulator of GroEL
VKQDSDNLWVVAIISPECESCKELLTDFSTITSAENLAGRSLKFGVVDASTDAGKAWLKQEAADLDIKYTPTLVMFGKDKSAPTVYDGLYNHDPINEFICNQCDVDGYAPEVPTDDVTSKDVKADVDAALGKDEDDASIETVVEDALKKDATDVQGDIAAAVADKAQETDDKESAQAESHELSEEEALALIQGKGD